MDKNEPKTYIERTLETTLQTYLKRQEILAIVGPRQCGKTTLMKHIAAGLKQAAFLTFEDRDILNEFTSDIKLFIQKYVRGHDVLFLDEFQYAKGGGKQLKFIYDTEKTKIIISGSSSTDLSVQGLKYLVGRILAFKLAPLSFEEFLKHRDPATHTHLDLPLSGPATTSATKAYDEYLTYGGYPAVVLADTKEEKIEILKNIYNVYLLREIRDVLQIADDEKLIRLMKALALQAGELVNYRELSALTEYTYPELKRYLGVLKNTFICLECRPFFTNKRKELVKMPKIYFLDSGFRNAVLNDFREPGGRPDNGALNESFVAAELFKKGLELRYWRTTAGAEVDFVVQKGSATIPVEVKTTLRKPVYGKSLKNFLSLYTTTNGFVFSRDYSAAARVGKKNVRFLPLFLLPRTV